MVCCIARTPSDEDRSLRQLPGLLRQPQVAERRATRRVLRSRVCCDNELIVQTAARELFAPGVDDFAFCGIRNHFAWTGMRARAFESLVKMHGGRFHKIWMSKDGSYDKKFLALLRNIPKRFVTPVSVSAVPQRRPLVMPESYWQLPAAPAPSDSMLWS